MAWYDFLYIIGLITRFVNFPYELGEYWQGMTSQRLGELYWVIFESIPI